MINKTHYVTFYFRGILFSDTESKEIQDRDPTKVKIPEGAFAFEFYDKTTQDAKLEDGRTISSHTEINNKSKRYYPNAEVYSVSQIEKQEGKDSILCSNMRCNEWKYVIKTNQGNYVPFDQEKDILI